MRKLTTFIITALISTTTIAQTMVTDTVYVSSSDTTTIIIYDTVYTFIDDTTETVIWTSDSNTGGVTLDGFARQTLLPPRNFDSSIELNLSDKFLIPIRDTSNDYLVTAVNIDANAALAIDPTLFNEFAVDIRDTINNSSFSDLEWFEESYWFNSIYSMDVQSGALPWNRNPESKPNVGITMTSNLNSFDEVRLSGAWSAYIDGNFWPAILNNVSQWAAKDYVSYFQLYNNDGEILFKDTLEDAQLTGNGGFAGINLQQYGNDIAEYWMTVEDVQSPIINNFLYSAPVETAVIPFEYTLVGSGALSPSISENDSIVWEFGHHGTGTTAISNLSLVGVSYGYYEMNIDTTVIVIVGTDVTTDINDLNTEPRTVVDCFTLTGERIDCDITNQITIVLYSDGSRELQMIK